MTRVLKGQLDHLGLRIRTWAPTTGSCGNARVLPVGAPVYVLAAPHADGTVTMSACSGDVGRTDWRDDLEALAAAHPETAGHFPGIDVPSPAGRPSALPPRSGQQARVRRDGALVALGDRWRKAPADDPVDGCWRLAADKVVLHGARAGEPLIAVAATPNLLVRDPGGTGWREIGVSSPELVGRAWVSGPLPVVNGGEIGGIIGGSGHLQEVHLGAGDTLRDPTTDAVFAECDGSCTVIALDDEDGRVLAAAKHLGRWWVGDVVRAE